ncbi:MAG: helix-turn-helix domain-containing protein [Leptospiraceae bacterium]|nr:helix-turn-helix domain-containing protein [Leptospiraceae bacterium]
MIMNTDTTILEARHHKPRRSGLPHRASHDYHVLMACTEGSGTFRVGTDVRWQSGDLLLIPAGAIHENCGSTSNAAMLGISFQSGRQRWADPAMLPLRMIEQGAMGIAPLASDRQQNFATLFESLRRELGDSDPLSRSAASHILELILLETARAFQGDARTYSQDGPVFFALQFVREHCLEGIRPSDVADALGLHPAYLTTEVHKRTGAPLGQWILRFRMEEAKKRLRTSDSIEEIAEALRFGDSTHFIRQFKSFAGQTPTAWRRNPKDQQQRFPMGNARQVQHKH